MKIYVVMKKCWCLVLAMLLIFCLTGCGNDESDVNTNTSMSAIVKLPDGSIVTGEVEDSMRWSESSVEVKIDGVIYNIHSLNVAFIKEG